MKAARPTPPAELAELRARLTEAEETLRAIHSGEVDAVVVAGKHGLQVFTLEGAEQAYRVLIESMNEGALTLTAQGVILYANQCFAKMVKCPLEQVIGSSLGRFHSAADRAAIQPLLKRTDKSGSKIQVLLNAGDGSQLPAQISIRPLAKNASSSAAIGMVVTDITEARRNEEMLRALTHRVLQVQEAERGHVVLDLHDNITQPLCAVLAHSQALVNRLSSGHGPAKSEAQKLHILLSQAVEDVERISRYLYPSVLEHLGLHAVLRATKTEFSKRTGVPVKLVCGELTVRIPLVIEMALFRIFQEALTNVEKHARARHVTVRLRRQRNFIQLVIHDDGIGFDFDHCQTHPNGNHGLGLLGMRERANFVGGTLRVKSASRAGTEIDVRIPLPPGTLDANSVDW